VEGRRIALVVVPDLMFQPTVAAVAARSGFDVRVADTPESLVDGIAARPVIAVVDVHAAGIDALAAIRAATSAGARVLAFGRHTEPAALRAARDAGAVKVVPRSELAEHLPALLQNLLAETPAE
jgi:DNA-binding NarL/FixJ family response regulator